MADVDYFLDLSSPDPLADEVPSSVQPATRRISKSQHDLSSFSMLRSSPRRQSRAQSPRKRTFQLDVGDERSPQRIRVTVEAEDALKYDTVNRKLFPPPASPTRRASPLRSSRRRETTTTTTVPLNDEAGPLDGDGGTPQKRGRLRRTSNGTPMPRGRKRAGTPIQRKSKQARQEDQPSPEAGILNDALSDMGSDGGEETPRPKTKIRKTPRKPSGTTSVPSSRVSSKTTGRKRGRPRKVPVSEEPTLLTGTRPQTTGVPTPGLPTSESNIEDGPDRSLGTGREEASSRHFDDGDDDNADTTPNPPRQSIDATPPVDLSSQDQTRIDRSSASPTSSHQVMTENEDLMMSEDYQGTEPQSDLQSAEGEDGITYHGQDTIADASDFSMIAVESLPSFQASFQTSFHEDTGKLAVDDHEMGEETSQIINQTLDSLRKSLRNEVEGTSHAAEAQTDSRRVEDQNEDGDEMQKEVSVTTDQDSRRGFLSSPRRPKHLPLSRQVFVGRGNVDDSFSSIPDSILHAATPGHPPMKPTATGNEYRGWQDGSYDDSFSEVPEAVLEAATPRPMRHPEISSHRSPGRTEEPHQTSRPTARRSSPDYGSSRLPTPEETSSSNAGSRQAHEEDIGAGLEPRDQPGSVHRTDVPSSPPIRTRPRALDFGYPNLQHEFKAVEERLSSSPQRQSLEAPLPSARPSLSPIVRVGRTLQNVMSDNSSPDGQEGNLGSPFKGSVSNDHPRQSLVAASSSPSVRSRRSLNRSRLSAGSPTQLNRTFRSNLDRSFGRVPRISGEVENSPASQNVINPRTEPLRDSTRHQPPDSTTLTHTSSMSSSAKIDPPTAVEELSWAGQGESSQRIGHQQPSFQTASFYGPPDATETRSTNLSKLASADTDSQPKKDHDLRDEPVQDMDEDLSDRFDEPIGGDEDDGDEVDIWDIEASRTSPAKPESALATLKPLKPDVPSSRRSKVPSPWRRNNRRLIYKDNIASSSQIEIEESSQSEVEQYPPVQSRQRPPVSQSQQDTQRRAPDPETVQKSPMTEDLHGPENTASPNLSHDNFGEYPGLADTEESDDDMVENEELALSEQPREGSGPMHKDREEHEQHEQQEDLDMPTVPEASKDVSEYSMVVQQARKTPKEQKKPPPSKSGFFGGFDILSFFSSPALLPTNKSPGPEAVGKPAIPQPALETRQPKEPPRALWSTGLFPSMPRKEPSPISGRRTDLSSAGSALRSTDTVADTYEPSTSVSPSPSRSPSASAAPSTPERQDFPPIEQKRNFTPRPGQSRGSLFTSTQPNSSAARGEVNNDIQESSDEQESSALTESSEYERVPPREKPSQWDRNLSPTKSCFRSPLKPTTPGRIVAFSNSTLSPLAQAQARNTMRDSTNARNTISQGPPLRPVPEDETIPKLSTGSREKQQPRATVSAPAGFALSQTTWSRQHWSRLDEMLQLRRRDPLRFQQVCALPPRDKRGSSVLLGKEVSAQDARLVLEPWHLEIVEAFKLEVGGWDERILAKRLFALVIGEEKRRATAR